MDVPCFGGIFWVENEFKVSVLVTSQIDINLQCHFGIITVDNVFDQVSYDWLKFWILPQF